MSNAPVPVFLYGAVPLGARGLVVSWQRVNPAANVQVGRYGPAIVIMRCESADEGVHTPAASIDIYTRESLLALRDAIDQALSEGGAA